MRKYLLLLACLVFAGCSREDAPRAEVVNKLESLDARMAAVEKLATNTQTVRWAFANRSEISTALYVWSQAKLDEANKAEKLPPEVQEKISQYEALNGQLMHLRMPYPRMVMRPGEVQEPTAEDKAYAALAKKVADAKEPVAEIIDRRNREAMRLREVYSVERVVGEYVKGRYDLVVDANEKVLYRAAGEIPDITEGVLRFFREKQK